MLVIFKNNYLCYLDNLECLNTIIEYYITNSVSYKKCPITIYRFKLFVYLTKYELFITILLFHLFFFQGLHIYIYINMYIKLYKYIVSIYIGRYIQYIHLARVDLCITLWPLRAITISFTLPRKCLQLFNRMIALGKYKYRSRV